MTQGDAARRVRLVDGRMLFAVLVGLLLALVVEVPAWALEFTADLITHANGKTHVSNLYYRDDRWRLEHQEIGPVNVTIVRKDKQVTWLLISRLKHYKEVPYDASQDPKVQETLDGEISRSVIGTETLDGHPTTLYKVHVQEEKATVDYYQWLATDIHFPLKLVRKDGSWSIEYRRVRMGHLSDFLFQLPVNFQPLEEFDSPERKDPHQSLPDARM